MPAIRSTLFLLFQIVTVVPVAFGCLLWSPLPRHWRYRLTMAWPRMVIWGARIMLGIRHEVRGAGNLPDGPAILLSKHQSTWETLFYPTYMPRELCYVFKRELLYLPFFGWGIWLLDMIHIDRSKTNDAFEQVVRQGERKLAQRRWIIMFPEGTRTRVGSQGRYKRGGARLAVRTGAPVVPIAVVGSDDQSPILADLKPLARLLGLPGFPITPTFPLLGPLGLLPYPVRYRIVYGEPIDLGDAHRGGRAEDPKRLARLADRVQRRIQGLVNEHEGDGRARL